MKVTGSGEIHPWVAAEKIASTPSAGPGKFGEIFKKALDAREQIGGPGMDVGAAEDVAPLSIPPGSSRQGWAQVEGFLNTLEDYRSKLADPGFSLRAIDPIVREMENGRDALTQVQGTLPDGDGLKEICNRALVTAAVEIVKFRRGDYIAA
jgi:hypothetical protein